MPESGDSTREGDALLWHYTSFAGLEGIAKGKIWASAIECLNDTQEARHTFDIADEILSNVDNVTDKARDAKVRARQLLTGIVQEMGMFGRTFVACFSEAGDDLSQWRAYGRVAPSFAIGFHRSMLDFSDNPRLVNCIYDKAEQTKLIDARIKGRTETRPLSSLLDARPDADYQHLRTLSVNLVIDLMTDAPLYKNPKFGSEREVRLVAQYGIRSGSVQAPIKYRVSGSLVVPYVEIALPTSAISAVLIGPCPHPLVVKKAIGSFLSERKIAATVAISEVPLRA